MAGDTSGRRWAALGLGLTLVPLAVAVVVLIAIGSDYLPTADIALTELRTRDIGRRAVLLGPHSREGWSHFGPAMFYVLAPIYRLFGSQGIGLAVGALLVNGTAVAGMALIARRLAGTVPMLLTLLGSAVLIGSLGPEFVRDPWNPYLTVLPFGLLLFLCWAMTCGERWALPTAVATATFCVQTHVGYLAVAVPLVVWGAGWLLVTERRRAGESDVPWPRRLVPAVSVTALVLVVMWLPPLIEQVTGDPGNVSEVFRYFRTSEEERPSALEAVRAVGGQFVLAPQWVTGDVDVNPFTSEPRLLDTNPWPALLLLFAAGWLVLARRGVSAGPRLAATLLVALVAGVFAVSRTLGPVYAYRLRWTWVLGMTAMLVAAWGLWELIQGRVRRAEPWFVRGALVALVAVGAVNVVQAAEADVPYEARTEVMQALAPSFARELAPEGRDGEIVVETRTFAGTFYRSAVVLWLETHGAEARVSRTDEEEAAFGRHRLVSDTRPPRAVWTVAVDREVETLADEPDQRLIAYWGVESRAERAKLLERRARLDEDRAAGRFDDPEYLQRALALEPGRAVAVFARPPPDN